MYLARSLNVMLTIQIKTLKANHKVDNCGKNGTVEPILKDCPIGHKNVVCQDRWSLVTGSVILKYTAFCQKCVVCQDRWSLMVVVSQDQLHCTILAFWCAIFLFDTTTVGVTVLRR